MKYLLLFFFLVVICFTSAQTKDTRTFEQINDSILNEAHLIYRYDQAFHMMNRRANNIKKLKKSAGEILVYPQRDTLISVIFSEKEPHKIISELRVTNTGEEPTLKDKTRVATPKESTLLDVKHKIFNDVQANYEVTYSDTEFFNPIFIPYTQKKDSIETTKYKLYLVTETNQPGIIPFGRDYLFYADEAGKVIYYLQFNIYLPVTMSQEVVDENLAKIEYDKREPYITPTDIYLLKKYGVPYGVNNLSVLSNNLGIYFNYNDERETFELTLAD